MTDAPLFLTLAPAGMCHENALLRYLELQGTADAQVELVAGFDELFADEPVPA